MATITPLGDPNLHFWLTHSVARSAGLNLSEALQVGTLSADDYAAMVTQCRQCRHVTACQNWLADPADDFRRPPEFCAIGGVLEPLRRR